MSSVGAFAHCCLMVNEVKDLEEFHHPYIYLAKGPVTFFSIYLFTSQTLHIHEFDHLEAACSFLPRHTENPPFSDPDPNID